MDIFMNRNSGKNSLETSLADGLTRREFINLVATGAIALGLSGSLGSDSATDCRSM